MARASDSTANSGTPVHLRPESARDKKDLDVDETRAIGDGTRNPKFINQLLKTEMCRRFRSGKCHAGKDCAYAHSKEELRSRPHLVKTKICPAGDKCHDVAHCTFAHSREELEATNAFFKTKMCAFGRSCLSGDKCRFRHSDDAIKDEPRERRANPLDTFSACTPSTQLNSSYSEDAGNYSVPDRRLENALASPCESSIRAGEMRGSVDEQRSCLSRLDEPFEPLKIYTSPRYVARTDGTTPHNLRSV